MSQRPVAPTRKILHGNQLHKPRLFVFSLYATCIGYILDRQPRPPAPCGLLSQEPDAEARRPDSEAAPAQGGHGGRGGGGPTAPCTQSQWDHSHAVIFSVVYR